MRRGVLALLFFVNGDSSFCWNCLSLFTVLFVRFAYLCAQHFLLDLLVLGQRPIFVTRQGVSPGYLLVGVSPPPICYQGRRPFYLLLYLLYHSTFCWICLFVFIALFVRFAQVVFIALFVNFNTPVHSTFCQIYLCLFIALFACVFCHPI